MKLLRKMTAAVSAVMIAGSPILATAATPEKLHVGHATNVINKVTAELDGQGTREIVKAEEVYFNENVITSGDASLIVQFRDGSTFELGPNGAMILDEMVFNPYEGETNKVITLVQGSFRYLSGFKSKNSLVTINTPVTTIGIRGSLAEGVTNADFTSVANLNGNMFSRDVNGELQPFQTGNVMSVVSMIQDAVNSAGGRPIGAFQTAPASSPVISAAVLQTLRSELSPLNQAGTTPLTDQQRSTNSAANQLSSIDQLAIRGAPRDQTTLNVPDLSGNMQRLGDLVARASAAQVLSQEDAQNANTPEQQAVLNDARAQFNVTDQTAQEIIQTAVQQGTQKHDANTNTATEEVVTTEVANASNEAAIVALTAQTLEGNQNASGALGAGVMNGLSKNQNVNAATVVKNVTKAVVTTAVNLGLNPNVAAKNTVSAIVRTAALTGQSVGSAAAAATAGAVEGGKENNLDTAALTSSATEGAVQGAQEGGGDATQAAAGAQQGARDAGAETGTGTGTPPGGTTTEPEEENVPPKTSEG